MLELILLEERRDVSVGTLHNVSQYQQSHTTVQTDNKKCVNIKCLTNNFICSKTSVLVVSAFVLERF